MSGLFTCMHRMREKKVIKLWLGLSSININISEDGKRIEKEHRLKTHKERERLSFKSS